MVSSNPCPRRTITGVIMKEPTRPACYICGIEGEFHRSWPGGGGEMRLCQNCNFVFAWPVSQFDPGKLFANAYGGKENRAHMDEFNDRMRMRQVRVQSEGLGLWNAAHRTALEWLNANVQKGETIVEIGCGVGSFMHALRRRGYNATGLDVAPEVVKSLAHEDFETWCGTIDAIPEGWPQTKPAAIVSFFVLHHVTDPVFFLNGIRSRWAVPLLMGVYRGP